MISQPVDSQFKYSEQPDGPAPHESTRSPLDLGPWNAILDMHEKYLGKMFVGRPPGPIH